MAFRKKINVIIDDTVDVLILQECEEISKLNIETWAISPTSVYWYGKNTNKGLAVFTFNGFKIDGSEVQHNESFVYVIPLIIYKNQFRFLFFAVWTQNTYDGHYTRQIYNAIGYYKTCLETELSVIIGDFNSNSIWDKKGRESNHSNLVLMLSNIGIESVYHNVYNENQGKESIPTLYFLRKRERPYHIDYCFVSRSLLSIINSFEVGNVDDYIAFSDHMPITTIVNL
ncbi:endonuclease/exonuclease/phosphatase family protein [Porphyromonadaceae bacterium]